MPCSSLSEATLVLLDVTQRQSVSGVDRYLEMLTLALKARVSIVWISLVYQSPSLGAQITLGERMTHIFVPFPEDLRVVVDTPCWMEKYNVEVMKLVQPHLDYSRSAIIHLHTLNLIGLALLLKGELPNSKIITHLHCIPWKGYINNNISQFSRLYHSYYLEQAQAVDPFMTHRPEIDAYSKADHIICLTECAREFVSRMHPSSVDRINIVPNGLSDWAQGFARAYGEREQLRLIFVGTLSKGKGLDYILEAMRIAQESGARLAIDVAGTCNDGLRKEIHRRYPKLSISLHGSVERDELITLYRRADIGVIASLQEQCSYVAIEMCMMGLPIITTAVDGLDEMFEDEVNSLKVPVFYSRTRGLSVNTDYYAKCIARLATDSTLRERLGTSARKLYLERYTADIMEERTVGIYNKILGDNE